MARQTVKDLYSILGVSANASAEELRAAYLARTRVIHPDRFDRHTQPQDWASANEMLAELNEAYSTLRNASTRAQYDNYRARQHNQPSDSARSGKGPSAHSKPSFSERGPTSGQSAFADLPKAVQERLLKRQANASEDQIQIKMSSLLWNYVYIIALLGWYAIVFADANGPTWDDDTILLLAGITVIVALLIARNLLAIVLWAKSHLKPYYYVTPLYFIKTGHDIVSFRPLWTLADIAVTHNYRNGAYQKSTIVFTFDGHRDTVSLSSKQHVEALFDRLKSYDTRLRTAGAKRDGAYFQTYDDFIGVSRSGVPDVSLMSRQMKAGVYFASVVVCLVGLVIAIVFNEASSPKHWVSHPTPSASPVTKASDPTASAHPQQPLPPSGSVRVFTDASRIAPLRIEGTQGTHNLVKLVDAYTKEDVLTVFVRSGAVVNIDVPLGAYEIRYASGDVWYGYEYLFGARTDYSKADRTFVFDSVGQRVTGYTITLYKVTHGNLSTSRIAPTGF